MRKIGEPQRGYVQFLVELEESGFVCEILVGDFPIAGALYAEKMPLAEAKDITVVKQRASQLALRFRLVCPAVDCSWDAAAGQRFGSRIAELSMWRPAISLDHIRVDSVEQSESTKPLKSIEPPKSIELLLWLLLPRATREYVIGDAAEAYAETVRKYGSRTVATVDYCKEAFFAVLAALKVSAIDVIDRVLKRTT